MATSSAILQSFLRDALDKNQKFDDLHFEDLLEYNRARCSLLRMPTNPEKCDFDDIENYLKELKAPSDSHAIIWYDNRLYYADAKKRTVKRIVADSSNITDFNKLKHNIPKSYRKGIYKEANAADLKLIHSVTGRAFSAHRCNDFQSSLDFYLGVLDNTDRVMLKYMSDKQKEQRRYDLRITLMLLLAQKKHEQEYQKYENRKLYDQQIKRCLEFLKFLDPEYELLIEEQPEQDWISDDKLLKYLGIFLGQELAQWIIDCLNHKSKTVNAAFGYTNDKRLSWVWDSTFLKTIIEWIPKEFPYSDKAAAELTRPDTFTGYLSWVLYYARFSFNLFFLLKHTIKGPWMSEEEAKIPWTERFMTQWNQRKFGLLNDFIWGTANLACFFWLNGKVLGPWGDLLTVALLVFDVTMAIWDFAEQQTKYNKQMLEYEEDITRLKKARNKLKLQMEGEIDPDVIAAANAKREQMKLQINALTREKAKCASDWHFQKISLVLNISYSVGLLGAFILLTLPFLPVAPPLAATLALVGAVLCLAFTVLNSVLKGGLEFYKTYQTRQEARKDYEDKLALFNAMLMDDKSTEDDKTTEDRRKLLFLEIKKLKAETEYQNQMLVYQSLNIVRDIILKAIFPAFILCSVLFLPMSPAVIAAAVVLTLAFGLSTYLMVEAFKPEKPEELAPVDEDEYNEFCEPEPVKESSEPKKAKPSFFSSLCTSVKKANDGDDVNPSFQQT